MYEIFRKRTAPELARIEVCKSVAGRQIGEATRLFRVPRVLRWDERGGEIHFEKIPGLKPLRQMVVEGDPELLPFLRQAGRALAVVHEQLELPREVRHSLPLEWLSPRGDNVCVHGDFAALNLCRSDRPGEVVIIDWSLAPYFPIAAGTSGSRWFDILWFVLYLHQGVAREALARWSSRALAAVWLQGYQEHFSLANHDRDFADRLLRKYYWPLAAYYCRLRRQRAGQLAGLRQMLLQSLLWWRHGRQLLNGGIPSLLTASPPAVSIQCAPHPETLLFS